MAIKNKNKKTICIIPARYASKRLPGKPLLNIKGLPLIMWVYNRISGAGVFDDVVVATDDERILDTVRSRGGTAVMTSASHTCGTDRIHEAVRYVSADYIVNVQGDEPLIPVRLLKDFRNEINRIDDNTLLTCATNATIKEMRNPNAVKVVCAANGDALYFSRSPIPFHRDGIQGRAVGLKHIGIYGFSRRGLQRFCNLAAGKLEKAEKLEQLRALEAGMKIRCIIREYQGIGIDTPRDLAAFRRLVAGKHATKQGQR